MLKPSISVIITVFNKKNYIRKCIQSILNQTYHNIEVIIIDDGSSDGSGEICDELNKLEDRLTVIHQMNLGVARARNKGIEKAKGEYIIFVDGDDYLSPTCLNDFLDYKEYDLVQGGYVQVKDNTIQKHIPKLVKVNKLQQAENVFFDSNYIQYFVVPWAKMYKTSIVKKNNIKFPHQEFGEDTIFVLRYINYIKSIIVINNYPYYDRILDNSESRKYINNLPKQLDNIMDEACLTFRFKYNNNWSNFFMRQVKLLLLNSNDSIEFRHTCKSITNKFDFNYIKVKHVKKYNEKCILVLLKIKFYYLLFILFSVANWLIP